MEQDGPAYLLWKRLHDEPIPERWRGVGGFSTFYQDTGGLARGGEVLLGQGPDYYDKFMSKRFRKTASDGTRQIIVVDDEDAQLVREHNWSVVAIERTYGTVYAVRRTTSPRLHLHQLIMGPPPDPDLVIDHRDRDKLNNRRSNLRWATVSQNKVNSGKLPGRSTPFKGVQVARCGRQFRGTIRRRADRLNRTAYFDTATEAARWYDTQALELFGEFACTNEMLGLLDISATHDELVAVASRPLDSLSEAAPQLKKESHG